MGVPDGPGTRTVSDLAGYLELPTPSLLSFSFWVRKGQRPAWSRGSAWLTPGHGSLLLSWGSRWQPFPSSCALGHLAPSVGSEGEVPALPVGGWGTPVPPTPCPLRARGQVSARQRRPEGWGAHVSEDASSTLHGSWARGSPPGVTAVHPHGVPLLVCGPLVLVPLGLGPRGCLELWTWATLSPSLPSGSSFLSGRPHRARRAELASRRERAFQARSGYHGSTGAECRPQGPGRRLPKPWGDRIPVGTRHAVPSPPLLSLSLGAPCLPNPHRGGPFLSCLSPAL